MSTIMQKEISFEDLLKSQVQVLTSCQPKHFNNAFRQVALETLEWFKLDRITLFPNSMILLNDGKTLSVSRDNIPTLNTQNFVEEESIEYLKLLRSNSICQIFDYDCLKKTDLNALQKVYKEGARWHGIIRLELFGQVWGALAFARFNQQEKELSQLEIDRLKLLSDTWLVYWQHSTVTRNLNQDNTDRINESEKLLKLTKKQCTVLTQLAQGLTAKQCAEKLFLSPRTIESHKYRMLDILELDTHTELVQFALRNGLGLEIA